MVNSRLSPVDPQKTTPAKQHIPAHPPYGSCEELFLQLSRTASDRASIRIAAVADSTAANLENGFGEFTNGAWLPPNPTELICADRPNCRGILGCHLFLRAANQYRAGRRLLGSGCSNQLKIPPGAESDIRLRSIEQFIPLE